MNINIKTKNLDLTPSLRKFIDDKIGSLERVIKKWEEKGAVNIDFEVARTTKHHHKGEVFYAEINLSLGGSILRAQKSAKDIRKAINMVKSVIKEEIAKLRGKEQEM